MSLVCVEVLEIRDRLGANLFEVADRVVSPGHSPDARVCNMWLGESESIGNDISHTEIGESLWASHHRHRISSRGWAEELSAFVEVIEGAVDFYDIVSTLPD